jgi:FtsH-binding integral membrane protein
MTATRLSLRGVAGLAVVIIMVVLVVDLWRAPRHGDSIGFACAAFGLALALFASTYHPRGGSVVFTLSLLGAILVLAGGTLVMVAHRHAGDTLTGIAVMAVAVALGLAAVRRRRRALPR